jgi:hypothetical protein
MRLTGFVAFGLLLAACGHVEQDRTPSERGAAPGLAVDRMSLAVTEGRSARLGVRLSEAPGQDVVVDVRLVDPAGSFRLDDTRLTFTPGGWDHPQYVRVAAHADGMVGPASHLEFFVHGVRTMNVALAEEAAPPPPPAPPSTPTAVAASPRPDGVVITVKDSTLLGATGYPTTAVVPLPYGKHQDTTAFRLVDAEGRAVPAQFEPLNRWWARDRSLRHVAVHFQASVDPGGKALYGFRATGAGPMPPRPVTVAESGDVATVDTGAIRFTVRRRGFNLFDEVWLDEDGDGRYSDAERIVAPDALGGPAFTGRRPGDVQRPGAREDLRLVVEEKGPMRAVIRVSGVTLFHSTEDHRHGFAVRIFAYAGKSFVKVDYQLQNSPKNSQKYWPLYFEDLSLRLRPDLAAPTVRLSVAPDSVWSGPLEGGKELRQTSFVDAEALSGGTRLAAAENPPGRSSYAWADVSDARRGLFVAIRNMAQMWPNGIEVAADGAVLAKLWPSWGEQWLDGAPTPSGLYWLEDMQHVVKETLLFFHGADAPPAALARLAKTFQFHPVPFVDPGAYYATRGTLDLDGILPWPVAQREDADLEIEQNPNELDPSSERYAYGWLNYGGKTSRKDPESAGGSPDSHGDNFAGAQGVGRWFLAEIRAFGDLNTRPIWLAEYTFRNDFARHWLTTDPYGGKRWRAFNSIRGPGIAAEYLPGTRYNGWKPRDDAHAWFYHVEEFYYLSANPWVRDWYDFMGEFRMGLRSQKIPPDTFGGMLRDTGWSESRGEAHDIATATQAFRVTGKMAILDHLRNRIANSVERNRSPIYGIWRPDGTKDGEAAFQVGYLARALIGILTEVETSDPDLCARIFNLVWGIVDWNHNLCHYGYYIDSTKQAPGTNRSAGVSTPLCDPVAWFYLRTGRADYLAGMREFIESGIHGGKAAYDEPGAWRGGFFGRVVTYVANHPWTPRSPDAIADLRVTLDGGKATIEWTTPPRAARFHAVWSTVPISPVWTGDPGLRNPWACRPVGNTLPGRPGERQSLAFDVPAGKRIYAAVFSFDAENAMSAISNVAQARP